MKASDLFVRCLEAEGVQYIFGIPGEENLDLLNSLKDSSIKLVITRHEQAAGFMAATYGRLTGKAGVCLSTLGPGATNLVTAAAYAQLGAMPMVMITGQKPIKRSKQGQFQIIDVVDMMQPITKYARQIVGADTIPSRVREAFRRAEEERPGAALLELPEDVAAEHTNEKPFKASLSRRPVVEEKALRRGVQCLEKATSPLLLIGAAANRKLTAKMLRLFVEKQGIPFITTQMGKGVVDESHVLCIGNAALSEGDFLHQAIRHADLLINVGHDVVEKPPFFMQGSNLNVIHINFNSAEVDTVYFPQTEMIGDIANSIWQLNEALSPQKRWDFSYFRKVRDAMVAHEHKGISDGRFPVYPQRLVADIRKVMGPDDIIALDNGVYKIWFARNYQANSPNTVLLDNALASMGAGLPSAMAAKLVFPNKKVLAICGDGGFMMNSQEVETAVRLGLDLVVLILNDSAYGMIKWKQAHMGFDNFGLDFNNPDFIKYAESYGARGHRLGAGAGVGVVTPTPEGSSIADELVPLLQNCLQQGGVHLIDVPIDYSENDLILNQQLPELSSKL